jgi:hypothetical protein
MEMAARPKRCGCTQHRSWWTAGDASTTATQPPHIFHHAKNWKILRTVSSSLQYQHQAKNPNRDKANVNTRKNKKNRLQSEGLSVFQNTQFVFRQISTFIRD